NTLYGRSTQAGAVNIITRQPTNVFEFNGVADYGRFNDANIRASVSGPVVEDQLFLRLAGSYASRDAFLENTFLDSEVDEQSGWTGRAQILWTPSEDWNISFNASVDDYDDGAVPFVLLDQSDPFETERDFDGFNNLNANTQSLRIAYDNPDFRMTSITARRFSRTEQSGDADATILDIVRAGFQVDSTVWSQELRLQSPDNDQPLEWLVGGYFESRNLENIDNGSIFGQDALSAFGLPPATAVFNSEVDTNIFGIFGQVSYQPIEPLTLTAGLRYENTGATLESLEQTFTPLGGAAITTFSATDVEQTSEAVLPRFVAQYRFNPNVMVYGSISRGFKPAGVNPLANNDVSLTFGEERSWNYELGVRSSWLDDRLAVNFTFFHNPVNDYQVVFFDSFTALPSEIGNADVSITGFELETRATPLEGLDFIAGFGLANARFTDFSDPVSGESFNGNRVPYAPEFTYNLAVQYRSPIGLLGRLELQGLGKTFFEESNTLRQDPFAIVNARLGYEFENYGIFLFANNIFDNEYLTNVFPFGGGINLATFGTPATYGIQFRARF
ncbi:MAG: TonB-dependent receptor, partial [Cyanobacteria bacterium P01_D01_bin.71]